MIDEIWKDIDEYQGLYQVSNLGRIKSLERTFYSGKEYHIRKTYPEQTLVNRRYKTGYLYVGLCKDGVVRKFKVHRLVAQAFIPNTDNKPYIDHINSIRDDNRVENLRWVDSTENMNNPHTQERISISKVGERNPMKQKQKPVIQIDPNTGHIVKEYAGCKSAARELGLDSGVLSKCCRSNTRKYKGYIFKYKE